MLGAVGARIEETSYDLVIELHNVVIIERHHEANLLVEGALHVRQAPHQLLPVQPLHCTHPRRAHIES